MYLNTHVESKGSIKASRNADRIWLKIGYDFSAALELSEVQQVIAELQRELAVVEAAARGAAA